MNANSSFLCAYDPIAVLSKHNSFMLYEIIHYLSDVSGDVAEVGVFRGGSANLIANAMQASGSSGSKTFFLFDVFETKIPEEYFEEDDIPGDQNYWNIPVSIIKEKLKKYDFIKYNVGLFENTCSAVSDKKFSFVHIDCDYYKAIIACCNFFYPRLVDGGAMFLEDYGLTCTLGATRAADKYFSDKPFKPMQCSTSGALVVKGVQP